MRNHNKEIFGNTLKKQQNIGDSIDLETQEKIFKRERIGVWPGLEQQLKEDNYEISESR